MIEDGLYICDYCGQSGNGEYYTATGNHISCQDVAELEAENARLLVERDEWKERAEASNGLNTYWRGEVARLEDENEQLRKHIKNLIDMFPEDIGERGNYFVRAARAAL